MMDHIGPPGEGTRRGLAGAIMRIADIPVPGGDGPAVGRRSGSGTMACKLRVQSCVGAVEIDGTGAYMVKNWERFNKAVIQRSAE
jgi:hypothetical protein